MRDTPPREIDGPALKALAHPLRIRLLDLLAEGPATATQLAHRLGETSGATSYHLRQLAGQGFVEEVHGRGRGRERWWRAPDDSYVLRGSDLLRDAGTRTAAALVIAEVYRARTERLHDWLSHLDRVGEGWRAAGAAVSYDLVLDPDQLRALVEELREVIERHTAAATASAPTAPGTAHVEVQLNAFPIAPVEDLDTDTPR